MPYLEEGETRAFARASEKSETIVIEKTSPSEIGAEKEGFGRNRGAWIAAAGLTVGVLAAFSPVLGNGFTNWDDGLFLVENARVRHLDFSTIGWAFTTFRLGIYHPLTWLAVAAQYAVAGLFPAVFHATSLAAHAVNIVLLFVLNLRIMKIARGESDGEESRVYVIPATLAVALYAVHPQRAEVVSWVTVQAYLFGGMSLLATVLFYLDWQTRPDRKRVDPRSLAAFTIALLLSPTAVVLPGLLLVLDFFPLRRLVMTEGWPARVRQVVIEKLPYFALSLVFAGLAIAAKKSVGSVKGLENLDLFTRVAQTGYAAQFYPINALIPFGISPYYPRPTTLGPGSLAGIRTLAVLIGICVVVWAGRRSQPGLIAAIAAYLIVLAPHLGLVQIGSVLTADRYGYLAMMVWTVPLAFLFQELARRTKSRSVRIAAVAVALATLVGLISLSREQTRVWKDSNTLWAFVLGHGGGVSPIVRNQAGIALAESGRMKEAIEQFSKAVEIAPGFVKGYMNLGESLIQSGQVERGLEELRTAIRLDPEAAEAHRKLGDALASAGRTDEAEKELTRAARIDPESGLAQLSLGVFHLHQGREKVAIPFLLAAAKLGPDVAPALTQLGIAHLRIGDRKQAIDYLRRAVEENPRSADARNEFGIGLSAVNDLNGAIAEYEEAIRLRPEFPDARNNLGVAFARQGKYEEASKHFAEAVRLRPGFAMAHSNLGSAFARIGRPKEAESEFLEALRIQPDLERASRGLSDLRRQFPSGN